MKEEYSPDIAESVENGSDIKTDIAKEMPHDSANPENISEATGERRRPSLASHHRSRHHTHHTTGSHSSGSDAYRATGSHSSGSDAHRISGSHSSGSDAHHTDSSRESEYRKSPHHHSYHHETVSAEGSSVEESTGTETSPVNEESTGSGTSDRVKARERIPLAAHHRSRRRRHRSGERSRSHHYSSLHRTDYTASLERESRSGGNNSDGRMMTIGIDMEEFERIQRQMREEEAGRTISVEATETTKEDRKEPTSGTIETETQSEPSRLASAIIAAREAKPRSARKASTIESTGSRVRRRQAKKKATAVAIILRILIVIVVLLLGGIGSLVYMRAHGQATMTPNGDEIEIVMPEEEIPQEVEEVEDDGKTITYKGQKYRWNDNLTTILFLGTDRTVEQQDSGMTMAGKNGQADTILLGVIDNTNRKISFINVNRDTFIPVAEYTSDGDYAGEKKMQICLSYAYGQDNEQSCQYTAQAVSKYLFGMPIDYYVRLSYDAIPVLNDSVGGVTVTVLEDLTRSDGSLVEGSTITLAGSQALTYVRSRDMGIVETNEHRISRQKQYLYAFMRRTIEVTRSDLTLPLGLYQNAKPYMTTNITPSQVTYMTSKVLEYGIADDAISGIPGESVDGADNHVEFYPDQTALYERVLETFYNKVES